MWGGLFSSGGCVRIAGDEEEKRWKMKCRFCRAEKGGLMTFFLKSGVAVNVCPKCLGQLVEWMYKRGFEDGVREELKRLGF